MSNVNIIRLNSGEEIICQYEEVTNADGAFICIKNPAILIPSQEGKLMFAKWLPYMKQDNGIHISEEDILFRGQPMDDLKEHYLTVVVNNLMIPTKKISGPELKLALDS